MTEKDKQDCLQGVQEYIKQNTNSQDKEALMQAIEKVLQQNYIFDSDVLEVLDYIGVNIWGIYHKGYMDFKGKWHDDYYELELGIYERGSLCCGMIKDAIRLLKKKYTYMQSRNVGGSSSACGASPECVCPADSDVSSVGGVSPENGKVQSKQPQQLERERKLAKPLVDSGRFIIFAAETPPSAQALALFCYPPYCKVGFFVPFWDYFGTFGWDMPKI